MDRRSTQLVVVPRAPGPIEPVGGKRSRDEVDDALDDLFGEPDDRGPGVTDAVLVGGGGTVAVAGAIASWPGLVVAAGVGAAALGLILPARSLWRSAAARRNRSAVDAQLAGGVALQLGHPGVDALVERHDRLRDAGSRLDSSSALRIAAVAHAAVYEVATLLGGRHPAGAAELEYVDARTAALDGLLTAARQPDAGRHVDSEAHLAARREVEAAGGSSVADADALARELRS